jgi:subtilisin family serine protease
MKKLALITVLACIVPAAAAGANPFPTPQIHPGTPQFVPGQLIVKFKPGADGAQRAHALNARGARTLRTLPLANTRVVHIGAGEDVRRAAMALAADPAVAWAQPDYYQEAGSLPNDPFFGQQWGLDNTGQTLKGVAGTPGADIDIADAWKRTTGSPSVEVAVVDSGVDSGPPDLAPNIAPGGWDFVQDDGDPSDAFGHGTFVAGILGAKGNDGTGVAGVDWNASILPVRVLANLGVGTCSDIGAGMAYAADHGARIVNISIRGYDTCQPEEDAMAAAPNTLFVTIAGNEAVNTASYPTTPCMIAEPNNICVAATDQNDQLADFSNYGPGVDLAAPGQNIKSTWMKWQPLQTLLPESFETALPGRWNAGGSPNTWDRTIQNPLSGVFSLTDSPFASYQNDSYNYVDRTFDLRNRSDCSALASVQTALGAGDYFLGQNLPDGVSSVESTALTGMSSGYQQTYFDMAPLEGRANGHFRFSLLSDASGVGDGVYVDDFSIVCAPPVTSYSGGADEFEVGDGTSFAAPYVSGVAALVLSVDPTLTAVQLKKRLVDTVDPLPSLTGKVESGGRLDAAAAVGPAPAAAGAPTQSPPSSAPSGGAAPSVTAELQKIRAALRHQGIRGLLRKRGLTVRLHPPAAGRFTVTLRTKAVTIAKGSGQAAVKVRATSAGRRVLRKAHRLRVTLTVAFSPASGAHVRGASQLTLR